MSFFSHRPSEGLKSDLYRGVSRLKDFEKRSYCQWWCGTHTTKVLKDVASLKTYDILFDPLASSPHNGSTRGESFTLKLATFCSRIETTIHPESNLYSQARQEYKRGRQGIKKDGLNFWASSDYVSLVMITIHDFLVYHYHHNPTKKQENKDQKAFMAKVMRQVKEDPTIKNIFGWSTSKGIWPSKQSFESLGAYLNASIILPCFDYKHLNQVFGGGQMFVDFFLYGTPTIKEHVPPSISFKKPTSLKACLEWEVESLGGDSPARAKQALLCLISLLTKLESNRTKGETPKSKPQVFKSLATCHIDWKGLGPVEWQVSYKEYPSLHFLSWKQGDGASIYSLVQRRLNENKSERFKFRSGKSRKKIHPLDCPRYPRKDSRDTHRSKERQIKKRYHRRLMKACSYLD